MTKKNEVVLGELKDLMGVTKAEELPKAVAGLKNLEAKVAMSRPWVVTLLYDPLHDSVHMGQVGWKDSDPDQLEEVVVALRQAADSLTKKRAALLAARIAVLEKRVKEAEEQ